jgi:hypothetical protein
MDKDELLNNNQLVGLNAAEIWKTLYNKELSSKKNILEYIDITRVLKGGTVKEEQIKDTYNFIYDHIESLKDLVKPNTLMYLKNNLKSQLGKYVKEKDPKPVNHFIEFFKAAYPENNRRKDFTWVLMDINSISEEQAWTTLTYINKGCLSKKLKLNSVPKKDIVKVIEKLVGKGNVKFINNIKSLKQFTDILGITIVNNDNKFKIKYIR